MLTPDHKGSNALEAARIRDLGGRLDKEGYVEGSLGVTRALGDRELHPYVSDQPEVRAKWQPLHILQQVLQHRTCRDAHARCA